MPENVLVVVLDTVRADALEPYGAAAGATPALAQLAARGAARPDVFSTSCWTMPSHASMFSGKLPRALGLSQAPGGTPQSVKPVLEAQSDGLLPEVLRQNGWDTRAVSANFWVSPQGGFATGFDQFELVSGHQRMERVERNQLRGRVTWALEGQRAREDDGAAAAEQTLAGWLDQPREKPFFWFVNLVEAHSPYLPPRPYNDLGLLDRMRAASEARRFLTLDAIWQICLRPGFELPDAALERMRHLYARSVRLMDDWVARLLERLDERGLLDDTLVLVTSDHGENFGENDLMAHAFSLDDRLIRVPFVASDDAFAAGEAGALSLARLPELLAARLGLDSHPWEDSSLPEGIAGAQFDFVSPGDPRIEVGVEAWGLDDHGLRLMTEPLTCVTDGRRKLQLRGDSEELYDLDADPLEERPGEPTAAGELEALRAALGSEAVTASAEPADLPAATGDEADVEDLEQRMKLLGYL